MEASLTQRLKSHARILGFHAVGIAPAKPFEEAASTLASRMAAGQLQGYGFSHGCESRLTDPTVALPGARSIVAVALSYFYRPTCVDCEDFTPGAPGPRGRVSRFAWGSDYHEALNSRLQQLADWLREQTKCESLICADTGPILDRAAAQQAGVGWYGKNCSLITEPHGSWVVLGELVTTAELKPGQPCNSDRCGSCQLCMKACPTGAIVEPFVVDATRCISHLTQMNGYAPRELRELIGDRVYGCDVCQEVCPQNRTAMQTNIREFQCQSPPGRRPSLIPLLRMTQQEFDGSIARSTMAWIRLTRLRRNAIIAIGNSGDKTAIPDLTEALSDASPVIRGHAAWALRQLSLTHQTRAAIESALVSETDEQAKLEMQAALAKGE